ncbi:BMP family ABC transporter substrate-binding protein [Bowdeniella nasicola]|uniref:BMP family ABC transporter substrate-binding protein n=1 Tax=Bowdeniella nasicola TaxID=208480 RepID=A0A1Q5PZV7_9ACTO|nr:BMP family ABC transporter substrate-binding protein [Bowdeniella nasicola]OKL53154.1 BMP family ABC transporter substrate-binding protein [Bowdeniella nasicola]
MKKSVLFSTMAAAALVLSACGQAPEKAPATDSSSDGSGSADYSNFKACMVSDEGGFDDRSFNQSGFEGLKKAESELGVKVQTAESRSPGDYQQNIDSLINQNCNLIIGVGFLLNNAIRDSAKANPDVNFALIDSRITEGQGDTFKVLDLPNAKPLVFNTAEAGYLAGYVAAGMSESGKLGTFGGMDLPSVKIFMDGFEDGMKKYNEDNGKSVTLAGWSKESQTGQFVGNFSDTNKGKQITENMLAQGVDIVMPVAGPVGSGTVAAVKEAKKGAVVWVDSDGFKSTSDGDVMLTSVVKEIGQSVFDTVKSSAEGKYTAEAYVGTIENGGVAMAEFHDFDSKVPAELKEAVEKLKQQIVSGEIKVETKNQP